MIVFSLFPAALGIGAAGVFGAEALVVKIIVGVICGAIYPMMYFSDLRAGIQPVWVPVITVSAFLLTLLLAPFFMFANKELAPTEDQGVVFSLMLPSATSTIDQNVIFSKQVQEMFTSIDEYENSFQITGAAFGFSGIILKPWSERNRSAIEIQQSFQEPAARIAGLNVVVTTPDPLPSGGSFPIEFVLRSTADHGEMVDYANQLVLYANTEANAAGGAPTFYFADSDLKFDLPQVEIEIDKDKVASMGLNLSDVARDMGAMLGGGYVNRFVNDGRSYRVIPQVERGERLNADQLLDYHVRGPAGELIPLSTIATLKHTVQPRTLNRFQQLNSIKITGVGPSVDAALVKLEAKAKEILPPGYSIDYGGQSRQLNIYSQIGLITLVGSIAKNGILIVEFANTLQEEGAAKLDAIRRACATRLRPILMTSAATVFGHMMLIFVTGPGAAARNSIGYVLVIGMALGSIFTLFVVPAFYVLLARDHAPTQKPATTDSQPSLAS